MVIGVGQLRTRLATHPQPDIIGRQDHVTHPRRRTQGRAALFRVARPCRCCRIAGAAAEGRQVLAGKHRCGGGRHDGSSPCDEPTARASGLPSSEHPLSERCLAGGGGLRAVATDTSVNPSAEPASMSAASKRATKVRMVASSAPVNLAKALAWGSAIEPATATVASWARPATS